MMKIRERYCAGGTEFITFCTECGTIRKKVVPVTDLNAELSCDHCGRAIPKMFDLKERCNFCKVYSHWLTGISSESII